MAFIPGNVQNTSVGPGQLLQPQLPGGTTLPPGLPPQQFAQPNFAAAPPTGLIGSEQALQGGLRGALGSQGLGGARQDLLGQLAAGIGDLTQSQAQGLQGIQSTIGQGVAPIQGFVGQGQEAQNRLGALLGLGGQEGFDQAIINDPAQAFAQEQGRRNLLAGASATGGLGGGRVLEELNRQGVGFGLQDLQNQRAGLSGLAGQGLTAAGNVGQLRGQQAGLESGLISNLSQARGQLRGQAGSNLGNIGIQGSNLISGTGQDVASGRTQAGRDLSNLIGGTTSSLSDLINQQGIGLSDLTGSSATNLANLITGAGTDTGTTLSNLANLLSGGQNTLGGNIAGLLGGGVPGAQQTQGASKGIGTLLTAGSLFSDVRLKENIKPIGKTQGGLNLYSWEWNEEGKRLAGNQPKQGVLAQEVQMTHPDAVQKIDGFYKVDYSRLN